MEDGRRKIWICLLVVLLAAVVIGVLYYYSEPKEQGSEGFLIKVGQYSAFESDDEMCIRDSNKPAGYSEEMMDEINADGGLTKSETGRAADDLPNIMFVQLESFFDPTEVEWLRFSEDPIPNLRKLFNEYSSG